jgi:hypothetical protein
MYRLIHFLITLCAAFGTKASMAQVTIQPARSVKIAVCQTLCIDGDREANFRRIENALEQAKAGGAQIACFPESVILGWENPDAHRLATPIPGEDSDRLARLAKNSFEASFLPQEDKARFIAEIDSLAQTP